MYFTETEACTPNPCQHGGNCFTNDDRTFTCNCTGIMYTGTKCEIGMVNIQEYPHLTMNNPYTFTVTASPDEYLQVFIFPDDRSSVIISPNRLEFNPSKHNNNFTIISKRSGRFLLYYRLSGESASQFMQLNPSNIIVMDDHPFESNDYFTSRGLQGGLLQSGFCTAHSTFLEYLCPSRLSTVKFNASCAWNLKGLYSIGIVFSDNDGVGFPVAIGGIKFGLNFELSSLNVFELSDPCKKCNMDKFTVNSNSSSEKEFNIFKPSVDDILYFLKLESLAYTYFYHSHQLLPRWLRFNVVSTARGHTSNSLSVTLLEVTAIETLQMCNLTTVYTDGLYSVLIYSGAMNISVSSEDMIYIPKSKSNALCFAVNLCEGKMSSMSISISDDINDLISNLKFMKMFHDNNWKINVYSLSISNSAKLTKKHALQNEIYWNGVNDVVVNIDTFNVILSDDTSYLSAIKDFVLYFSFTGKMFLLNDNIEMVCLCR